jgi:hypothetical protein
MKNPLITLLTTGRTVDRVRDRKGAYSLRYVNKLPKFGPAAREAAEEPPPAQGAAPAGQSALFEAAKAPAAVEPPKATQGCAAAQPYRAAKAPAAVTPPKDGADRSDRSDRSDRTNGADQPQPPPTPTVWLRWFAQLGAFLAAAAAVVPKTARRVRGRLRSPAAEAHPRAQGELALEKVTVLRNDLSDADLVVVAVQPKPEDSRAAPAETRGGNACTRVTARWVKLKDPAGDGSQTPEDAAGQGRAGSPTPAEERRGGPPRGAAEWAQTPS